MSIKQDKNLSKILITEATFFSKTLLTVSPKLGQ